ARYVHGAGIDSPILHYTAGQTLVYHQDGHNSVVATTDAATGALVATQGYGPWGNPNAALTSGPPIPTYGYTGREPDATGLVHYRARYYHPHIGRFTQPDPLGFIDGVNRYAYALNSPVNFLDPTGTVGEGSVRTPQANNQGGYWGSGVVGTFLPNIDNAIRNGVGDASLGGTLTGAGKGLANDAIGLINFAVGGVTRLAGGSGDPVLSQFTIAPEERLGAALGESAALATGLGAAGKLAAKGIAKLGAR
ncbi:RHS repeat-associated core domain-containing protein, partial [Halochromatium glycolicum]|uniref:RHS repeat-associated core domain-containing protein n=1 Tax=Halochromatium glycolicum TaxID=85075 RepID=UPI001909314F